MEKKQLPQAEVPRLFSTVAALILAVIAVGQGLRAFYGLELTVGTYHVPIMMSWIAAGVAGVVALFAFREA
jgi:hypothetical protein